MKAVSIQVSNAVARTPEFRFANPVNWSLSLNQNWAIIGPNGSGKTLFADLITGKTALKDGQIDYHFREENRPLYEKIKMISFRDVYSLADYKGMYYQQRWNSAEEETPIVYDLVKSLARESEIQALFSFFGIDDLLEKQIIMLSSGELRKFLIVRMLLSKPEVIILDNPYIGLDEISREFLNELLAFMSSNQQTQIILILSNPNDIPEMITHVLPIVQKTVLEGMSREVFLNDRTLQESLFPVVVQAIELPKQPENQADYDIALDMQHINIRYGDRKILSDLNWQVKKGEKWALLGLNGSGKSTLLSLVCADNPQSYANSFSLFGKKRGTGESIWDIKKRIGYVSPEMHLYFMENQACQEIVGSGFFDSVGLFRKCSSEQLQWALEWMKTFRIEHLRDVPFLKLSYGEQRLVMLARAFVKNPELLILDEPLHGLDCCNKRLVSQIIGAFCEQKNKTLIYVSHYLHEIPACISKANFKYLLNRGA